MLLGSRARPGVRRMMSFSPLSPSCFPIRTFSAGRSRLALEKMAENEALAQRRKVLTLDTMNANVKKVEYAVRGPIVQRAVQLEKELREVRCLISKLDQSTLKALEHLKVLNKLHTFLPTYTLSEIKVPNYSYSIVPSKIHLAFKGF